MESLWAARGPAGEETRLESRIPQNCVPREGAPKVGGRWSFGEAVAEEGGGEAEGEAGKRVEGEGGGAAFLGVAAGVAADFAGVGFGEFGNESGDAGVFAAGAAHRPLGFAQSAGSSAGGKFSNDWKKVSNGWKILPGFSNDWKNFSAVFQ
jgi:hypothetical protein